MRTRYPTRKVNYRLESTSVILNDLQKHALQSMEVFHTNKHIQIICKSSINTHNQKATNISSTSQPSYRLLPKELRRICGKVNVPPDGGAQLINYLRENDAALVGVSDASVANGNGTHSWILSTGESTHLDDKFMKLEGVGPVDGHAIDMSSARGELQGQTALAIMSKVLLTQNNATDIKVVLTSDNKGIQTGCNNPKKDRLHHHCESNMDLMMEYASIKQEIQIKSEWVKGHQDNKLKWSTLPELQQLKLSNAAKLNILCDSRATAAQASFISDPEGEVLPSEKWAVYTNVPSTRKVTGKLKEAIMQTLHRDEMLEFIKRKHGLTEAKLEQIDTPTLGKVLKKHRLHNRASLSKLIHRWIPTNAFLHKQNRADTHLCPRCMTEPENADHILKCNETSARSSRSTILYDALHQLSTNDTNQYILHSLEEGMTMFLEIPSKNLYLLQNQIKPLEEETINKARRHQNLIGWDMLLRGFSSKFWAVAQEKVATTTSTLRKPAWSTVFVDNMLLIHKKIWEDRNQFVHGKTLNETRQKARQAILKKVREIYQTQPVLAKRYPRINQIPLEDRLKKSTNQLKDWIYRVEHQIQMSQMILSARSPGQLTLREAYQAAGLVAEVNKYPP
jgi:hypothetical protein